MAITSISRIQQRRGKKNSGTGLPQLASGELAWAIDTQELFIGNGSVAEGAPMVGNSRILTEYDLEKFNSPSNIFTKLDYVYKSSREITSYTFTPGHDYLTGTYNSITLVCAQGATPIALPVINAVVDIFGTVSEVTLVSPGSGVELSSIFIGTIPGAGGDGFTLTVSGITNANPTITNTVVRTIQDRLDDRVVTTNFGSVGDGITDDTDALQFAIYELYLKDPSAAINPTRRTILEIPAGVFKISDSLRLPSYTTIVGAGEANTTIIFDPTIVITGSIVLGQLDKITSPAAAAKMIGATVSGPNISGLITILDITGGVITLSAPADNAVSNGSFTLSLLSDKPVITFVNDSTTYTVPNITTTTGVNQPRHVSIKNLTIASVVPSQTIFKMESVRDSSFENINISGNWGETISETSIGINMTAISTLVTCSDNTFSNISMSGVTYGCYSDHDILNNKFISGVVSDVLQGFSLGANTDLVSFGQEKGPSKTKISGYRFNNVKQQAVIVTTGSYNVIDDVILENVGNDGGITALYPQIIFVTEKNTIANVISDRSTELYLPLADPYIQEFNGVGTYTSFSTNSIDTTYAGLLSPKVLFKLPLPFIPASIIYRIDYTYRSTTLSVLRKGTYNITINSFTSGTVPYGFVSSDDFDFTGKDIDAIDFVQSFVLSAEISILTNEIIVSYTNTPVNRTVDVGIFSFSYTAIS